MGLVTRAGAVLLQFGVAYFFLSLAVAVYMNASGYPVPAYLSRGAILFKFTGLALGGLMAGAVFGVFRESLAKAKGAALYILAFAAAAQGIIDLLRLLAGYVPMAPAARAAVTAVLGGPALFLIGYYVMARLGYAPPD